MLSANPYDRPPAIEVQQRIYQIMTEVCGISEPHCVHQYSQDLETSFGGLQIQSNVGSVMGRSQYQASVGHGTMRTYQHSRNSSSGEYSQGSRTTTSSEAEVDGLYMTGHPSPPQMMPQGTWSRMTNAQGQLYAAGP
jgi:hypothetical protein